MKPLAKVLITDLDNTLWDWFKIWHSGFLPFLKEAEKISGISANELKTLIRPVHQEHGTSEYSFLLQSIPEISKGMTVSEVRKKYAPAIAAYNQGQKPTIKLYPTVAETLLKIRGRGTRIVGYTDSLAFYTIRRLKKLGLDGVLDVLYSPRDHEIPPEVDIAQFRMYDKRVYRLEKTQHLYTPKGEAKPNPHILRAIVDALGVSRSEVVYVGDSLIRDVKMAQDAGVSDFYAEYGHSHSRPEYKLLQDVSHWTQVDVDLEQKLKKEHVLPSVTLAKRFAELLEHVEFVSYY